MIALLLLLQVASSDGVAIGAIPRQELPAKGCAAYLWSGGEKRTLVAMAVADPALIRLSIDGTVTDLARADQSGAGGFGFAGVTRYARGDVTATLDMAIATRADMSQGAVVSSGSIRIDRPGHDTIVLPVAGLIGCT